MINLYEQKDAVDFDRRTTLHHAAKEARLLAVAYLMGIAANPNALDRYGNTPLDLALEGGSLYHKYDVFFMSCDGKPRIEIVTFYRQATKLFLPCDRYCALLIQGWGGRHGDRAESFLASGKHDALETISLDEVRKQIDFLLMKGYDKHSHASKTELEMRSAYESSLELLVKIKTTKDHLKKFTEDLSQKMESIRNILMDAPPSLVSDLSMIPSKNKKERNLVQSINIVLEGLCESHHNETENTALEQNSTFFEIDSDEEEKLFHEIDIMMDTQERAEAFRGNSEKFLANSVQCTFRRIFELENAFRLVRTKNNFLCIA